MKKFIVFTTTIFGLLILSGQTAQKIGNRANQDISLCKNIGGGSERCLELDSAGVIEIGSGVTNRTQITNGAIDILNDNGGLAGLTVNQTGVADLVDIQDNGTSIFKIKDGAEVLLEHTDPRMKINDTNGVHTNLFSIQNAGSDYGFIGSSAGNEGGLFISAPVNRGIGMAPDNGVTVLWADADNNDVELIIPTNGTCDSDVTNGNVCSGTYTGSCTKLQGAGTCDATANGTWQFMRVGNMVTITGQVISSGHSAAEIIGIRVGVPFNVASNGRCTGSAIFNEDTNVDTTRFMNVQSTTTSTTQPCNVRWVSKTTTNNTAAVFAMYDVSQ